MHRIEKLKKAIKDNKIQDIVLKKTDTDLIYKLYAYFLKEKDYSSTGKINGIFMGDQFLQLFDESYLGEMAGLTDGFKWRKEPKNWSQILSKLDNIILAHINTIITNNDLNGFIDALTIWKDTGQLDGSTNIEKNIRFQCLNLLPDILHKKGKDEWILPILERMQITHIISRIIEENLLESKTSILVKALNISIATQHFTSDIKYDTRILANKDSFLKEITIILEKKLYKYIPSFLIKINYGYLSNSLYQVLHIIYKYDKKLFYKTMDRVKKRKGKHEYVLLMALKLCIQEESIEDHLFLIDNIKDYISDSYTEKVLNEIQKFNHNPSDQYKKNWKKDVEIYFKEEYLYNASTILLLSSLISSSSFELLKFIRKYELSFEQTINNIYTWRYQRLLSEEKNIIQLNEYFLSILKAKLISENEEIYLCKKNIVKIIEYNNKINDLAKIIKPYIGTISYKISSKIDKNIDLTDIWKLIYNGSLIDFFPGIDTYTYIDTLSKKESYPYIQVSFWRSIILSILPIISKKNTISLRELRISIYNILTYLNKYGDVSHPEPIIQNDMITNIIILKDLIHDFINISHKEDILNTTILDVFSALLKRYQNRAEQKKQDEIMNMYVNNSKISEYLDDLSIETSDLFKELLGGKVNLESESFIKSVELLKGLKDLNSKKLQNKEIIKILDILITKYPKLYFLLLVRSYFNDYKNNEEQAKGDFKEYLELLNKFDTDIIIDLMPENKLGILFGEYMKEYTLEKLEKHKSIVAEIFGSDFKIHNIWITALIALNKPDEAIKFISSLIESKPDVFNLYWVRCNVFLNTKQFKKAAGDLSSMCDINQKILDIEDEEENKRLNILVKEVPDMMLTLLDKLLQKQENQYYYPFYYWRSKVHYEMKNYFHALIDSNLAVNYCDDYDEDHEFLVDWNYSLINDENIQLLAINDHQTDSLKDSIDITQFLLSIQEWELKSRGILNTVRNLLNSNSVEPLVQLMKEKKITKLTGSKSWFIDNNYNFCNQRSKGIKSGSLLKDNVRRKGIVFDLQNSTLNPYFIKDIFPQFTVKKTPTELLENFNNIINIVRSDSTNIDLVKYVFILIFLKRISDMSNRDSHLGNSFWSILRNRAAHTSNDGSLLTNLIDKYLNIFAFNSPLLEQVFKNISFSECSIVNSLSSVILYLSKIDLSERSVSISSMGFAFNKIIETVFKKDKLSDSVITSEALRYLMVSLLEPEVNNSYYDPFIGIGGFQIKLAEYFKYNSIKISKCKIVGQEINEAVYSICLMNLFVNGHFNTNIFPGNTLNKPSNFINNNFETYDYVISHPPFGVVSNDFSIINTQKNRFKIGLPRSKKMDYVILHHIISSMSDRGKAVILIPRTVLYAEDQMRELCKYLIDKDWIESIISIPIRTNSLTLNFILVLNKNKAKVRKNKVQFINGENVQSSEPVDFNFESDPIGDIKSAYFSEDEFSTSTISTLINNDKIVQNNYNLDYRNYKSILFEIENKLKTGEYKRIKEIIELIRPIPVPENKTVSQQSIRISDLNKLVEKKYFGNKNFKISKFKNNIVIIEDNTILIALKGDYLKPTIFSKRVYSVSISRNILAFKPKVEIDIDYFYYQLYNTLTLTQLDIYRKGLTIPYITKEDFLNIAISVPSLEVQKELILEQKAITESNELQYSNKDEIETIIQQREFEYGSKIIRAIGHSTNSQLNEIENSLKRIERFLKRKELLNQPIISPDINTNALIKANINIDETIEECINKQQYTLKRIISKLAITREILLLNPEDMEFEKLNLKNVFSEFFDNRINESRKYEIKFTSDDVVVHAHKESILSLIDNLLSNAEKHAFDEVNENNYIKINIKKFPKTEDVVIEYSNNGKKFDISETKFTELFGKRKGSEGDGYGGFFINKIVKIHQGTLEIIPTEVGLKMRITLPIKKK